MGVGATGSDQDAYEMGRITALEGRAVGIHFAFAPVADVNNNPANPIINTRSFGEDPHAVARLVAAEVRGLQDNGMLATAKHFPGHGDIGTDSHLALPVLNVDLGAARLGRVRAVPRAPSRRTSTAVMSAHIALPAESGLPTPATLVPAVLTGMLRDSLHFKGVIVTDALNMGGIVDRLRRRRGRGAAPSSRARTSCCSPPIPPSSSTRCRPRSSRGGSPRPASTARCAGCCR